MSFGEFFCERCKSSTMWFHNFWWLTYCSPHDSGYWGVSATKADRLICNKLCRSQTVNEIWKKSSSVVVRMAGRLITFGLAVALILMLCKIHSLRLWAPSTASHPRSLPSSHTHTPSHTDACVHSSALGQALTHLTHMRLPPNTLTLSPPDART